MIGPSTGSEAGRRERWAALSVALVSALVLGLVAPIVSQQWAAVPAFIPAYQSAVAVNDLVTGALLFGAFREFRRPSILILAGGYLYTAVLVVAHTLSFPGLFGPAGFFGGPQTTVWLWLAWHIPLPLLVATYAVLARGPRDPPVHGMGAPVAAVGLPLLLAGGAVLLTTRGHDLLPALLEGNGYIAGVTRPALAVPLTLSLLALLALVLRTRLRQSLDLWLAVAMSDVRTLETDRRG
jgi:hypothetical protein